MLTIKNFLKTRLRSNDQNHLDRGTEQSRVILAMSTCIRIGFVFILLFLFIFRLLVVLRREKE